MKKKEHYNKRHKLIILITLLQILNHKNKNKNHNHITNSLLILPI